MLTVTFNLPRQRKAMTRTMHDGLYDAYERADSDDSVRVMVGRADGEKTFIAGTDISPVQPMTWQGR